MVVRASKAEPTYNPASKDYCAARSLFAGTARAKHPKDKPRVENQVPYVRERWFAGEMPPPAIDDIRRHAATWWSMASPTGHG